MVLLSKTMVFNDFRCCPGELESHIWDQKSWFYLAKAWFFMISDDVPTNLRVASRRGFLPRLPDLPGLPAPLKMSARSFNIKTEATKTPLKHF